MKKYICHRYAVLCFLAGIKKKKKRKKKALYLHEIQQHLYQQTSCWPCSVSPCSAFRESFLWLHEHRCLLTLLWAGLDNNLICAECTFLDSRTLQAAKHKQDKTPFYLLNQKEDGICSLLLCRYGMTSWRKSSLYRLLHTHMKSWANLLQTDPCCLWFLNEIQTFWIWLLQTPLRTTERCCQRALQSWSRLSRPLPPALVWMQPRESNSIHCL